VTVVSPSGGADVEIDDGLSVAELRPKLARLTGDAAWTSQLLSVDGTPVSEAHPAGRPPLCAGATLRTGTEPLHAGATPSCPPATASPTTEPLHAGATRRTGPLPVATRAARAPWHVAVLAGPDSGALLVPEDSAPEDATPEDAAPRGNASRGRLTLGPGGDLDVADGQPWLVAIRPARRRSWPWRWFLTRRSDEPTSHPGRLGTACRADAPVLIRGIGHAMTAGRRTTSPAVLIRSTGRGRRVPRWRWTAWRSGDVLRAGSSALVVRDPAPLPDEPSREPRRNRLSRLARLLPAAAGATTSIALATTMHQPVLLLGALSALVFVGPRGQLPPPAAAARTDVPPAAGTRAGARAGLLTPIVPHALPPSGARLAASPFPSPDRPADLAALRVALAPPPSAWDGAAMTFAADGAMTLAAGTRAIGAAVAPAAGHVPWTGELHLTGPRGAALAAARGLLLTALAADPGTRVVLRTDRPADWSWLVWHRHVMLQASPCDPPDDELRRSTDLAPSQPFASAPCPPSTAGDAPHALVVLDAPGLPAAGPGRVLRLDDAATPPWSACVLHTDGRQAQLRAPGGSFHAVPFVGVTAPVAEATTRALAGRPGLAAIGLAALGDIAGPPALGDSAGPPDAARLTAGQLAAQLTGRAPAPAADRCPADVALGDLPTVPPPEPHAIRARWRSGAPLVTPLGAGPDGAPVAIDLIRDGPHLLVAGTTGSGKSELLTTLVLGLALTSPPDRLAVLVVDFKGGTGLPALSGLPHVVGHLSDLDAAGARRTLRALSAELRRRERIVAAQGVRDLRDLGPSAPPRLLVVIDEFRVLADELPDLLPGLARIAAQGRSLGVHLMLATQRPAGAVPADLRANVALRVVLRVADHADSIDLVGVPDAADFERPGLALLSRGAWRPEPLQVAHATAGRARTVRLAPPWPFAALPDEYPWVPAARTARTASGRTPGAPTRAGTPDDDHPRAPAAAADHHGHTPMTTADHGPAGQPAGALAACRDHTPAGTVDRGPEAWVAAIRDAAEDLPRAAEPWQPPLPRSVAAADVPPGPGLPLALADLPDELTRGPVRWDPDAGHLLVLGGPGSGRSTALAAVATAGLAAGRAVHAVGVPARLLPPGVASVLAADDVTRVARLLRLLGDAQGHDDAHAPATVHTPGDAHPQGTPATDDAHPLDDTHPADCGHIPGGAHSRGDTPATDGRRVPDGEESRPLLLVDDVAAVSAALAPLARGAAADRLGQLWATAGGPVAIVASGGVDAATARLTPYFADRLVLGSPDPMADQMAGVPAELAGTRPDPGRAVHLGRHGAVLCQVALPGPHNAMAPARVAAHGVRPLPTLVTRAQLPPPMARRGPFVAIGLGGDEATPVVLDLSRPLLVVGPPGSGRTTVLATIAAAAIAAKSPVVRLPPAVPDDEVPAVRDDETLVVRDDETLAVRDGRARTLPDNRTRALPGAATHALPGSEALLLADDLDDLEVRAPAVVAALVGRLTAATPQPLVATTTTAHALAAFSGPVAALVRTRRLLVLDLTEPGSVDLLGPEASWLVDPRRCPPGRGALRLGRVLTPLQTAGPA